MGERYSDSTNKNGLCKCTRQHIVQCRPRFCRMQQQTLNRHAGKLSRIFSAEYSTCLAVSAASGFLIPPPIAAPCRFFHCHRTAPVIYSHLFAPPHCHSPHQTPMSLSILSTHHPSVCRLPRHPKGKPPPTINWSRVRDATVAAAAATVLSQIPCAPLDMASKLVSTAPNAPHNLFTAVIRLFTTQRLAAFRNLPMSCIKRVPTKALTIAAFEIGTQLLTNEKCPKQLSPLQHLTVAVPAGAIGLALTFPLHAFYYANRKGVPCANVLSAFSRNWHLMFSGALPAILSTPPAVVVDYVVYRQLRTYIDQQSQRKILSLPPPIWIVAAATAANLTGGICVEPFKALSRRMAVDSVKSVSSYSMVATAKTMLQGGVGEFWRGYRMRMIRYAVSAVVSKTAVRQLRRRGSTQIASMASSFVAPERRIYAAHIYPCPVPRLSNVSSVQRLFL